MSRPEIKAAGYASLLACLLASLSCTNSQPVRPTETAAIYVNISNIFFANPSAEVKFGKIGRAHV